VSLVFGREKEEEKGDEEEKGEDRNKKEDGKKVEKKEDGKKKEEDEDEDTNNDTTQPRHKQRRHNQLQHVPEMVVEYPVYPFTYRTRLSWNGVYLTRELLIVIHEEWYIGCNLQIAGCILQIAG